MLSGVGDPAGDGGGGVPKLGDDITVQYLRPSWQAGQEASSEINLMPALPLVAVCFSRIFSAVD
jgi:hypothetical protein